VYTLNIVIIFVYLKSLDRSSENIKSDYPAIRVIIQRSFNKFNAEQLKDYKFQAFPIVGASELAMSIRTVSK
jgi:hypothetical protein